jgi:hypothetical protein
MSWIVMEAMVLLRVSYKFRVYLRDIFPVLSGLNIYASSPFRTASRNAIYEKCRGNKGKKINLRIHGFLRKFCNLASNRK